MGSHDLAGRYFFLPDEGSKVFRIHETDVTPAPDRCARRGLETTWSGSAAPRRGDRRTCACCPKEGLSVMFGVHVVPHLIGQLTIRQFMRH
jgi:hypothetical protein